MWALSFWLRKLLRRRTKKIPENRALTWKNRLSLIYTICAWNAFGGVIYMCYTGKADWMKAGGYVENDLPPARSWAKTLGIPHAQVIKLSGFKVVGSYEINDDEYADGQTDIKNKEVITEL